MGEGLYTVYKHVLPNNKVYIGITSRRPQVRWGAGGSGYRRQAYFWNAIQKYGWDNIDHVIIASGLSKESASIAEKKLIKKYDSRNPDNGYNLDSGGTTSRGGWHHSEETKALLREMYKGEKNPMYGTHHTEEFKALVRKTSSFKRSEETRRKMSLAQKNRSEETKIKQRHQKTCVPVRCVETGIVYFSQAEAERETHVCGANIRSCLRGEREKAGGYHWEFATDLSEAC